MKDVLDKQNRSFAAAMARVSGSFGGRAPAPPFKVGPLPAAAPKLPVPIDPEAVSLGETEFGAPLSINLGRLLDGRLMVQGASGAGKSWLLRRIVEQIGDRLQQIVSASWSISTSFPVPSDVLAQSGPQLYKRAVIIQSAA